MSKVKATPGKRAPSPGSKKTSPDADRPRRGQPNGLAELTEKMRGIDLCMMTTQTEDGSLHTRPMSNNGKVDFDGDAWFFTSRDTLKVAELEQNEAVSLSYVGGSRDEPVWIALHGTGEIVDDDDKKRELWVEELERWFEGGPEDDGIVLIHVQAERATWWSGEEQKEVTL